MSMEPAAFGGLMFSGNHVCFHKMNSVNIFQLSSIAPTFTI